jgi:hypothetical protein
MWLFHHVPLSAYRWPLVGRRLARLIAGWQQTEFRKWRDQQPLLTDEEYAAFMAAIDEPSTVIPKMDDPSTDARVIREADANPE